MIEHFGVRVRQLKYGLHLTRDKYAIINTKPSLPIFKSMKDNYVIKDNMYVYSDEWCYEYQKKCLYNFDLNMKFFSLLDPDEFNKEIDIFLLNNKEFEEVKDLKMYNETPGYYLMILDEYKQLYIGTTDNIKRRIQQHWSKSKEFDRLLFPMNAVNSSLLSIDSFRALDTTRIYAMKTKRTYHSEDKYINQFSKKFICNRISGGKIPGGFIQALGMIKNKELK